ncbi:23S rRNA (uracil-5-)-methyltransferase RumA [Salinicola sp. MH3R3-1]|uniref:23S rRNA (uracil(1939)-C(5))-methyltransferase RlmD n=1 Tax=Salinicola sp. MH3R3-1 TaxID=1928762 RepID=UPI00094E87CC|nr:23S rRNA (uracil(1939)-C(5))-methyltransferase RlmD [Salinicola sp. MH3R3-1]OLO07970.1 23S rRNA (uracil-5-)-methyltransferase RumA [Salinicola sp. MH3R3-1]
MAMLGKRRVPAVRRERQPATPTAKSDDGALVIERLAHDGRGVARDVEGKTVFVDAALPGERVVVAIHRQRKRYDEAHIRQRLSDAASRVEPPCVYATRCGGCDLQHLSVDGQREHKRQVLIDLLKRQSIEAPDDVPMLVGDSAGYRRRARLGVKCDAQGHVHLGFRARGSEQLVDIDSCHVLASPLAALLPKLRAQLESLEAPRHVGHLELLLTDGDDDGDGDIITVVVRQLRDVPEDAQRWRAFAGRERLACALRRGRQSTDLVWLGDQPRLVTAIDGGRRQLSLALAPGDFLQVNAEINQRLIDTLRAWLAPGGSERLLDLFAGIGNFSLALADDVASVTAVEGSNEMVERLRDNADHNGLSVSALQADLNDPGAAIEELIGSHDTVLLDPPRDGADALCRRLAQSDVTQVAYISCDPASLARDAAHLLAGGFVLSHLAMADMFPHTAHLESLALFQRPERLERPARSAYRERLRRQQSDLDSPISGGKR